MLASVMDETAEVHLFGLSENGEFRDLLSMGIAAGDILVLHGSVYNEFEGNIELAESELVRHVTLPSVTEFVTGDTEIHVNDRVFYGNVVVSGNGANVYFENCTFNGNLINRCSENTVVWLMPGCTFAPDCRCVIESGVREASPEYPLPKFAMFEPVPVDCVDLGGVIAVGLFDVNFNGENYGPDSVTLYDSADGVIPFEEGMAVNVHIVAHWWENDNEVFVHVGAE